MNDRSRTNGHSERTNGEQAEASDVKPSVGVGESEPMPAINPDGGGTLIIIGGHEDKKDDRSILKRVAAKAENGGVAIIAAASRIPHELEREYKPLFQDLGVKTVETLRIESREDACSDKLVDQLKNCTAVFFTGGDQLKLATQIGNTPVYRAIVEIYNNGGTLAGTSAGAAAMSTTMISGGKDKESHKFDSLDLAPGLGFIQGVVIDSHFAERGRMGRLLGVVARNPNVYGIGIDEDTAIEVRSSEFEVLGNGAIYICDGSGITYSSAHERDTEKVITVCDVKLHVLGEGDRFDMKTGKPSVRAEVAAG